MPKPQWISFKKTFVLRISSGKIEKDKIQLAADVIRIGAIVAFPTETVYGLAADLKNKAAIDRLYKIKNRPKSKPFTIHISNPKTIEICGCIITRQAKILIKRFWPGPLTLLLKTKSGKKLGFRMPDNRIALELIERSKAIIVAPSANLSGHRPPVCAKDVLTDLDGKIDLLIDGGRSKVGIESTIVDLTGSMPKILREGAIKALEILDLIF